MWQGLVIQKYILLRLIFVHYSVWFVSDLLSKFHNFELMLYRVQLSRNLKWYFSWSPDLVWSDFEVKTLEVIFQAYKSDSGPVRHIGTKFQGEKKNCMEKSYKYFESPCGRWELGLIHHIVREGLPAFWGLALWTTSPCHLTTTGDTKGQRHKYRITVLLLCKAVYGLINVSRGCEFSRIFIK